MSQPPFSEGEQEEPKKPGGYLPPHEQGQLPPHAPEPDPENLSPLPGSSSNAGRNFLFSILIILLIGAMILFFMARGERGGPAEQDVLSLSVQQVGQVELEFETQNPDQASRYVWDKFGRRISTPNVNDAHLLGVGAIQITPETHVPAFIYRDAEGVPFVIYAYNYAILDRETAHLRMERSILRNIEDAAHREVRDLGRERAMIWRSRDVIFVAISEDSPEVVRRRIYVP